MPLLCGLSAISLSQTHHLTQATGVDVNVRFSGIDSFEFTDEVAVFDLLGMQLVHGWLVDPQVFLIRSELGFTIWSGLGSDAGLASG